MYVRASIFMWLRNKVEVKNGLMALSFIILHLSSTHHRKLANLEVAGLVLRQPHGYGNRSSNLLFLALVAELISLPPGRSVLASPGLASSCCHCCLCINKLGRTQRRSYAP